MSECCHAGRCISNLVIYVGNPALVCNCSCFSISFLISSSLHPFCRLACFPSGRPGSPWRCGWPRCWGRHPAGSPRRSEGTLGLASRHSHLLPVQLRYSIYYTQLLYGSLILPLKLKMHCQCDVLQGNHGS